MCSANLHALLPSCVPYRRPPANRLIGVDEHKVFGPSNHTTVGQVCVRIGTPIGRNVKEVITSA